MFYEFKHPLSANYFKVEVGTDFEFPSHMHHCFEILVVREGCMHVDVDERHYDLHAGDALLFFPNQIHSLHTVEHSRHVLCLFSPNLVSAYNEKTSAKIPVDNLFRPAPFYIKQLEQFSEDSSTFEIKGLLYSLCGCFDRTANYLEAKGGSNILLYNIFKFIELNYNKNCSLADLSKHTGYDYAYLSRYFKKIVGISYNDYVNQYRISRACYLLQNNEMTILEISNECGFNSLRSLNRNFKEQLGVPPAEYRKQLRGQESAKDDAEETEDAEEEEA